MTKKERETLAIYLRGLKDKAERVAVESGTPSLYQSAYMVGYLQGELNNVALMLELDRVPDNINQQKNKHESKTKETKAKTL